MGHSHVTKLILFALLIFPTVAAAGHENSSQSTSANCGGIVVNEASKPLAGIEIIAKHPGGKIVARAATNSKGRYCLTDLVAPAHYFFVNLPGNPTFKSDIIESGVPNEGLMIDWQLSQQGVSGLIRSPGPASCCKKFLDGDDRLTANIAGTMFDQSGKPVRGVEIIAKDDAGKIAGRSVTNERGRYCITDLLPAQYAITESPGRAPLIGETVVAHLPPEGLTVDWRVSSDSAIASAVNRGVSSCCQLFLAGWTPEPAFGDFLAAGAAGVAIGGPAIGCTLWCRNHRKPPRPVGSPSM